mmetsp:Transcript_9294/g.38065  ORF Transcript_9294/g.38065 Transcript_9294/m.38065 type:complete len:431 (-) Transcript_9294:137-1429(-)
MEQARRQRRRRQWVLRDLGDLHRRQPLRPRAALLWFPQVRGRLPVCYQGLRVCVRLGAGGAVAPAEHLFEGRVRVMNITLVDVRGTDSGARRSLSILLRRGLSRHVAEHGRECALLPPQDQPVRPLLQELRHLHAPLGCQSHRLQAHHEVAGDGAAQLGRLEAGGVLDEHLQAGGRQRLPPGDLGERREVLRVLDHKTCLLERRLARLAREHVWQAVAELNLRLRLDVVGVVDVEVVGHAPLVASERTTGLERLEDVAVAAHRVRRVHRRLDLIRRVEGAFFEGQVHEVALDELELVGEAALRSDGVRARHLISVVVEARHVAARERGDLARWAAHTAADVQHLHALVEPKLEREVMLMPADGLAQRLVLAPVREVEALTPAVLVERRRQVVVLVDHVGVHALALLDVAAVGVVELDVVVDGGGDVFLGD